MESLYYTKWSRRKDGNTLLITLDKSVTLMLREGVEPVNNTVQITMDDDMITEVEELYRSMGTSFAEAVRAFARQSLQMQGMPSYPTLVYLEDMTPQEFERRMMQAESDVDAGRVYTDAEFDAMMREKLRCGRDKTV